MPLTSKCTSKDKKAKMIMSLKQGTGKYTKSSRPSCFPTVQYRCGPQRGRGHWAFNEETKLIPIRHMERIQLCVRGEMASIIVVTSELNHFKGQNVLAPHVKDFIAVFELKFKLKKKKIKGKCWIAGYTVPRECPSSFSTSDLSSSSQKSETLRGSNEGHLKETESCYIKELMT